MKHLLRSFVVAAAALCAVLFCGCQSVPAAGGGSRGVVVLDIGHFIGGGGACSPAPLNGRRLEECSFWYEYSYYTKRVIEQAGYTCAICNRGAAPADARLAEYGRRAGVYQVNTPEVTGVYRSKYHPNRMAVGILSADYALDQKPGCVVFLHHNSNSDNWQVYNNGAIYCNRAGTALAASMAGEITDSLFAKDLKNNGVPCGIIIRDNGRLGGGDWLNTCNEHYVPAAITEAVFLSNPDHAKFLGNEQNAIRYAEAVGRGIVKYMQSR